MQQKEGQIQTEMIFLRQLEKDTNRRDSPSDVYEGGVTLHLLNSADDLRPHALSIHSLTREVVTARLKYNSTHRESAWMHVLQRLCLEEKQKCIRCTHTLYLAQPHTHTHTHSHSHTHTHTLSHSHTHTHTHTHLNLDFLLFFSLFSYFFI